MSDYVVVGGSRKNPAIAQVNFPSISDEQKGELYMSKMLDTVLLENAKIPDIPLSFGTALAKNFEGISSNLNFTSILDGNNAQVFSKDSAFTNTLQNADKMDMQARIPDKLEALKNRE